MSSNKFTFGINSFWLHILAFALMLCDHLWATVIPGNMWLTNIGRIAFPIFSFMVVEGYFHTRDFRKYMLRLLAAAVISEIPFDLMIAGTVFYPYHQNVLWTFLISLGGIRIMENIRTRNQQKMAMLQEQGDGKGKYLWIVSGLAATGIALVMTLLGFISGVDYYGYGVLTVLVFYVFRGRNWWHFLGQLVGMYMVHVVLFTGMLVDITIFGRTFEVMQQGIAILALLPIWIYNGNQGPHGKAVRIAFYAFYPLHMLILSFIALYAC